MNDSELNRRDFSALAVAAFGGILAGCNRPEPEAPRPSGNAVQPSESEEPVTEAASEEPSADHFLVGASHACRGLNACKGLGQGSDNACAGQGACATIDLHSCGGQNACKGQGGCGAAPAQNACKGQGGCAIPLHAGAWERARETFEAKMKDQDKTFSAAPERPAEG